MAGRMSLTMCVPSQRLCQNALSSMPPLQSSHSLPNKPEFCVTETDKLASVYSPRRLLSERSELPFCVDGSWASGARVERDGSGLIQVWSRQIQQLNRVSHAVASTVIASYQSPQLLLQVDLRLTSECSFGTCAQNNSYNCPI